ncbi:hypothetical protein EYF80_067544 [Liparis tanakae]|uniref:Uncharacterized protein n=1 Tax=Liparis tanakae TaxID=230148 RepID=A0A4Z2E1T9_9TELE|nr:hypothetical protein EYF80_067544 [Liparis tanakae]
MVVGGKLDRLTQNTSESKKKRPCAADGNSAQDGQRETVLSTSLYRPHSSSHLAGLSQSSAPLLPSSGAAEEEGQQHISVIQATGSAAGSSPQAPSHREASPLPSRSSSHAFSFSISSTCLHPSTSQKHFSHSIPPKIR